VAITPRENDAFFREVEEGLRQDKLANFWKRYGIASIALALLFLAALGGYFWWRNHQAEQAGKLGADLTSALERTSDRKVASAKLDSLAKSDSPGYRAAALLSKAGLSIDANDPAGAAALYRQVAADQDLDSAYRDLATIRLAALEYDSLPPQQVIDRLKPYAAAGNPWFGSAGEMTGMAYLKLNKPKDAARIFAAMAKDQKVPETIRNRASMMAGSLGIDAAPPPAPQLER
jgi:hypothetical protein